MATRIRLARGGAKKRPYYRIVVADVRAPRDGKYIEKIGAYNPMLPKGDANRVVIDLERAKYWLGTGAQPSERVEHFLRDAGLVTTKPVYPEQKRPVKNPGKLGKATAAEAPAEAPAEEAPAEEAASEESAA